MLVSLAQIDAKATLLPLAIINGFAALAKNVLA